MRHPTLSWFVVVVVAVVVVVVVDGEVSPPYGARWHHHPGNATDLQQQIERLRKTGYLLFPHVFRAFIDVGNHPDAYNVSTACQQDLKRYLRGLNNYEDWAWRFYDATGKQGAGLFLGALTWKGNFQQCLDTHQYFAVSLAGGASNNNADDTVPTPNYCSVFMRTPLWLHEAVDALGLPFPVPMPPLIADVCVPNHCTEPDLENIIQTFVNAQSEYTNLTVTEARCYKGRNINGDPAAVFSVTLIFVLIGCVGLGTAYDIFLRRRKLRVKRGPEILIGYQKDTKQYGILKVILAPHPVKLKRRATIGGYEKSDSYLLSELKVEREKLLNKRKTPSLPDISTGDDNLHEPARSSPPETTSLLNAHEISLSLPTVVEKDDCETTQDCESTDDCESHISSKKLGVDDQNNITGDSEISKNVEEVRSENDSSHEVGDDPGTGNVIVDEHIVEEEKTDSEMKAAPEGSVNENISENVQNEENDESTSELTSLIIKDHPGTGKEAEEAKDEVNANISTNVRQQVRNGPTHSHAFETHAVTHRNLDLPRQRSVSNHAESRAPHGTLRDGGPRLRKCSVFERQMSEVSNDSVFDKAFPDLDRRLYDIPEEGTDQQQKEKNNTVQPEVVIRRRPDVKDRTLLSKMVLAFSFRRSTKRIMAEGSVDALFCLNGVRVLSISWIVLGTVYMILYLNPDVVDNHVDGIKITQTWWAQVVINTTLASDSFFILSGTLGAYNFMKMKKNFKNKKMSEIMSIKEYFMVIFHRLVRLGPCYLIVIMIFTNLMPYMGKGPRWTYEITSVRTCKDHWWANALFFSNFYKADTMCMPHTYYLVNDFQFGLLSPLFLIPLLCRPLLGFLLLGGLVLLQVVTTLILDQGINGNTLMMGTDYTYFSQVYVKPYCRIGVYAIGLGLGYLLYVTKRQAKFRKLPLILLWALSLFIVAVLPFITYEQYKPNGRKWTGLQTAFFEALSRPIWGVALSWIIFACSCGQGAFINKLLSWNAFLPLCRITYGVYLLHPMFIALVVESRHNGFYLDFGELAYEFVASLVCCYGLSFILITFIESPFIALENSVRTHIQQRKKKAAVV